MKKIWILPIIILSSLCFIVGCGKKEENIEQNTNDIIEENIEPSGEIEDSENEESTINIDIQEAPEDNSKPKENYREEIRDFDENSQSYKDPEESTINNEETNTSSSIVEEVSTQTTPPTIEENKEEIIPTKGITSLKKVDSFLSPNDFDVSNLDKDPDFLGYQIYIKDTLQGASLNTRIDNAIIYSNKEGKTSIEFYPLEDCYAIYLHCVLSKDAYQLAENEEQIKLNGEVLKSLLNLISNDADKLYETIYNDYEVESTLSEKTYTNVGNSKVKAEAMQKYVIYYIAKK